MNHVEQRLREVLTGNGAFLRTMESMAGHTTFRIGGPARWYAAPSSREEMRKLLEICSQEQLKARILGNGSDLLVSDAGCGGLVISMTENFSYSRFEGNRLIAGAGLLLPKAASLALKEGLSGLEFASGIPGTVGGAAVMNAGAYGSEMKDVMVSMEVMDPQGRILTIRGEEMGFGYRKSCVDRMGYIVLEAEFVLKKGDPAEIKRRMEELSAKRREKQPLEYPSAGSTFKRPEGYFAGKLIEDAGFRGFRVGDAQVAQKHCGFVINRGNATAAQVMELGRLIPKKVFETDGVRLELEIRRWGEFPEEKDTAEEDCARQENDAAGGNRARREDTAPATDCKGEEKA